MSLVSVPSRYTIVTVCDMNQHALEFEGNYKRIKESILEAKKQGSRYRLGPELETCGYSCEDHLLEAETLHHNYSILAKILDDKKLYGIVIDIGCFIQHQGVRYNAKAIIMDGKILLIRPKTCLANNKSYFEARWFTPWSCKELASWSVPKNISEICGQKYVPIGVAVLDFQDTCIGIQVGQEVYVPDAWHQSQVHNGAEIIANGCGNMFEVGKLEKLLDLIRDATEKGRCGYMYSALAGCDGGRAFFDGGSLIYSCGRLREIIPRFQINETGFTTKTTFIDLDEIRGKRALVHSWTYLASRAHVLPRVTVEASLCVERDEFISLQLPMRLKVADAINKYCDPMEEIVGATTCWLWDYLVSSKSSGFLVPLNEKPNSIGIIVIIYLLCDKLFRAVEIDENEKVLKNIRRILNNNNYSPSSANDLCFNLLVSVFFKYNSTPSNICKIISLITNEIEQVNFKILIDDMCKNNLKETSAILGYESEIHLVDKTLFDLRQRQQMVQCYLLAQLYVQNKNSLITNNLSNNPLLVIGTANADKSSAGLFTKYGNCSGDISLLADISREVLFKIVGYYADKFNFPATLSIFHSCFMEKFAIYSEINLQTCKLKISKFEPLEGPSFRQIVKFSETRERNNSGDIPSMLPRDINPFELSPSNIVSIVPHLSMTYEEIALMRKLRKSELLGPLSMFRTLVEMWYIGASVKKLSIENIASKVQLFFCAHSDNRHKCITLAPSVHLSSSSHNDSRADFRPFLYNRIWRYQFRCIDEEVSEFNKLFGH